MFDPNNWMFNIDNTVNLNVLTPIIECFVLLDGLLNVLTPIIECFVSLDGLLNVLTPIIECFNPMIECLTQWLNV